MASVQELILAVQAAQEANRPFKGLVDIADQYNAGYDRGLQRKEKSLDNSIKLMQRDQLKQQIDFQKQMQEEMTAATEEQTKKSFAGVGGETSKPTVLPQQKLQWEISQDEKGQYSRKMKAPTPKVDSYTSKDYQDSQGRTRIGKFNSANGELIQSANDAYAPMSASEKKGPARTKAQEAVDRTFGAEYTRYVASGGYADTMTQITTLEDVLSDLQLAAGERQPGKGESAKNLTGPVITMQPDAVRKRTSPASMAAQQSVEQSVQRSLKQTLGGQFTEKEGTAFMQRGYDPALPEGENSKKLKRAIGQLKMMALAKQQAIDYYEENGTLTGFKGTFYTLKDGEMVQASKDDFYQMMKIEPDDKSQSTGGGAAVPSVGGTFNGEKVLKVERMD